MVTLSFLVVSNTCDHGGNKFLNAFKVKGKQ